MLQPLYKKIAGVGLVIIGLLALLTPFTPGSWLIFVGLSILGIKISYWEKIKDYFIKPDKPKDPNNDNRPQIT
jgi:uncharacterized protein YqgC (DUF456 family)